ncbi:RNA polymerase sigma factor [Sphingosinicella rhizophila]|uniref:RNA polymerase sigma factor n=1 Tax=Sphingosinicella rhizophila TaxID=3050082 RepID=A0ABU3Q5K1_9SPHN|nr:RNA polymerase sigma factor [Sphingosinicella sp. GR2756]MDT9598687.1 RNA polymerase sigma factor [Sphingosinicella sp. GR2756]
MTSRAHWFAEHILPYEPKVRNWLRRSGWKEDEVEDVIQESYARLASCAFEQVMNPGPFFLQTARNVATSIVRRRSIVSIRSVADVEWTAVADQEPNAEEQLSAYEELVRLKVAIEKLPSACRRVFIMRKIEGLSQAKTAKALGVSESNVEKHVARGIRLCAAALTRSMSEEGVPGLLSNTFDRMRLNRDKS